MRASGFEGKRADGVKDEGELVGIDVGLLRLEGGSSSATVEGGGFAAGGDWGRGEVDLAFVEGVAGDGLWCCDEKVAVLVSGGGLNQWVFGVLANQLHGRTCHVINHTSSFISRRTAKLQAFIMSLDQRV